MTESSLCYLCGSAAPREILHWPPTPTQDGVMCETRDAALQVVRGSVRLRLCETCGYIGNEGHEDARVQFDYYDFSNHESPSYAAFIERLSRRLIDRYDLRDKTVVDVGAGQGGFLRSICALGDNRGVGIDPGFDHPPAAPGTQPHVSFRREYYGQEHADIPASLIACRHLISLPDDPLGLLRLLRQNIGEREDTVLYVETPDACAALGGGSLWSVVYEHRSWFTEAALDLALRCAGFEILETGRCWNDAYLYAEARPAALPADDEPEPHPALREQVQLISEAASGFDQLVDRHRTLVADIVAASPRAVAWGSGAAAVTYFNLFDLAAAVPFIVDINPRRHGKFLPGSGQQIVPPEFLMEHRPELVIITNPTYAEEIRASVRGMGLQPQFLLL